MPDFEPYQIIFDNKPIHIFRKKKLKRMSIKICPETGIRLHAPHYLPEKMLLVFLESAKLWISKHYKPIVDWAYTHNEPHPYLGQFLPLNLIQSDSINSVLVDKQQINILSTSLEAKAIKGLVQRFYREQAMVLFPQRLAICMRQTPWVKQPPTLKYRFMRSRYGSCSSNGNISLNIHLIKARIELIDYVILHELCHIKEANHSHAFYHLMDEVSPSWRNLKAELKSIQFSGKSNMNPFF